LRRWLGGRFASLVVVLAGCNAVLGIDEGTARPKGAGAEADATDAPPWTSPCDPLRPFARIAAAPVPDAVGRRIESARLTPNQLTLYVSDETNIYVGRRTAPDAPFGPLQPLDASGLGSAYVRDPSISADERVLVFGLFYVTAWRIGVARQDDAQARFVVDWDATAGLSSYGSSQRYPYLAEGRGFAFAETRGSSAYLAFATPIADASYQAAALEEGLTFASHPVLTGDALVLYAATASGTGNPQQIKRVVRASTTASFGEPVRLTELEPGGASKQRWPTWVSPDGCALWFVERTALADGGVDDKLLVAEKP
jgi:hypothetical protein